MNTPDNMTTLNANEALTYLKDYREPDYFIDNTELHIDIQEDIALVSSTLRIRRNSNLGTASPALILDGVNMELRSLAINDRVLDETQYSLGKESLRVDKVPAQFTLHCVTAIKPKENTALVGLFQSKNLYCTQCEPQGFRHITYYLDRPDVLSEFIVTLEADKAQYPVLLANGNLLKAGDCEGQNNRHWAIWHDPFKKPSYLFALVAGNLECIEDTFTTCSGRIVTIRIFAEDPSDLDKCHHAMSITKRAMRWDEEVYGREYDLNIFMIAVVADFNYGGMENKGLNIYRADRLLIDPKTTTDADFQSMSETIAHEYLHNWSGNRVTCRDWFQLSVKEGFTSYRGLQFNQDSYSAAAKRIEETQFVRTVQFSEDASPLAHPIQPNAYRVISNFYTSTVYLKGAEVVRMLSTLLGPDQYRKGTDLFFQRHDGQAVTTEEFVAAMEAASNRDLAQFRRWYSQVGTPQVEVEGHYDEVLKQFTLTVKQSYQDVSSSQIRPPLHFPLVMSLVGQSGTLPFVLNRVNKADHQTIPGEREVQNSTVLEIIKAEQTFVFEQINEKPVPVLFQDFSAPVKWTYDYSIKDLLLILRSADNDYGRWEASQMLWAQLIDQMISGRDLESNAEVLGDVTTYYSEILTQAQNSVDIDKGLVVKLLTLPSEAYLIEMTPRDNSIDISSTHKARCAIKKRLGIELKELFQGIYRRYEAVEPINVSSSAMADRALRNLALNYLVGTEDPLWLKQCHHQFVTATNMTDTMAALECLVNSEVHSAKSLKQQALDAFYKQWQHQPLVVNQWFKVQACCPLPGTLEKVKRLINHPVFDIKSPNQVLALIGSFCEKNLTNFHHINGKGYELLVDQIRALNEINPQIASRLLAKSPLVNWRRYDIKRQELITSQLQGLHRLPNLANEISELVNKCL
jgi:aminopeptidase N